MHEFIITIGPRDKPRACFPVMAPDAETAVRQNIDLAGFDRMDVQAIRTAGDAVKARTQAAWLGSAA